MRASQCRPSRHFVRSSIRRDDVDVIVADLWRAVLRRHVPAAAFLSNLLTRDSVPPHLQESLARIVPDLWDATARDGHDQDTVLLCMAVETTLTPAAMCAHVNRVLAVSPTMAADAVLWYMSLFPDVCLALDRRTRLFMRDIVRAAQSTRSSRKPLWTRHSVVE